MPGIEPVVRHAWGAYRVGRGRAPGRVRQVWAGCGEGAAGESSGALPSRANEMVYAGHCGVLSGDVANEALGARGNPVARADVQGGKVLYWRMREGKVYRQVEVTEEMRSD